MALSTMQAASTSSLVTRFAACAGSCCLIGLLCSNTFAHQRYSICRSSFVTGKALRATTVQSAPRKVSFAVVAGERPLWFPGSTAPEWLDGRHVLHCFLLECLQDFFIFKCERSSVSCSLPGDYGFDPLGLCEYGLSLAALSHPSQGSTLIYPPVCTLQCSL